MTLLAFDIETIVSDEGKKLVAECDIKAPANYRDPAKIAEYVEEKRKELLEKAALYWWTGKIVCISAVDMATGEKFICLDKDERALLGNWLRYLEAHEPVGLVGKNSDDFDMPWLRARCMRHDLGLLPCLRLERKVFDVQKIFGYSRSSGQVTSLSNMAVGLALPIQKTGSGKDVARLWELDKQGEIMEYCLNDSYLVAEIYKRYEKMFVG